MDLINKLSVILLVGALVIDQQQRKTDAARILGMFPLHGKSHFIMSETLMRGLAARGHQADVVSHFPLKNPPANYRDISIAGSAPSIVNNLTLQEVQKSVNGALKRLMEIGGTKLCDLLDLPQIQNPPTDPPYDLVVVEAITYGVPLIGFPIFGDQFATVRLCERKNVAISFNYRQVTADSFTKAIDSILKDPSYRENVKRLSKLFTDRPISALDTATFWVEHVLRNGNVLRSPATELTWWQLQLLDVYAFLVTVIILALFMLKRLIRFVLNLLFTKSSKKQGGPSSKSTPNSKKNK